MRKNLLLLALAALAFAFTGCEPTDANKDYGFAKVYIPQATVTGMDNSYPIPLGPFGQNTSYTCYYEDGKLYIALGVVRAGALEEEKGFTVDLVASKAETDKKVKALTGGGTAAVEMPSDVYELPAKIEVPAGDNTGTCYMSVDLKKLSDNRASIFAEGKYANLVLGLEIKNPTEYELADKNTSVVVVLDLNSAYWNDLDASKFPESAVRPLFPLE